ncbi:hypothetical protein NG895_03385 [Aeoliella sp. ICT_H6.2]|uniref:Uncharacterized protein n=1 Tax=Aeoliella straminimaris TaxID=2954799 RepID=A0A9X2JFY7_9BACT|nr:hypothetical protein [Aeoliella straminimaris]MCO6042943.1 hypothetical protein [Aeoliella straminimaris]
MNNITEANVSRESRWLVVPLEGAIFPPRCVKTNDAVDTADYLFEADLLRGQIQVDESTGEQAARLLLGRSGRAVMEFVNRRRLKYRIGLSPAYQAIARKRWRLGIAMVIVGPILAFALSFAGAFLTGDFDNPLAPLPLGGLVIGILVMIAGIVLFGMAGMSLLRVIRSDGVFVWLEGANPDFLDSLPESPVRWK